MMLQQVLYNNKKLSEENHEIMKQNQEILKLLQQQQNNNKESGVGTSSRLPYFVNTMKPKLKGKDLALIIYAYLTTPIQQAFDVLSPAEKDKEKNLLKDVRGIVRIVSQFTPSGFPLYKEGSNRNKWEHEILKAAREGMTNVTSFLVEKGLKRKGNLVTISFLVRKNTVNEIKKEMSLRNKVMEMQNKVEEEAVDSEIGNDSNDAEIIQI